MKNCLAAAVILVLSFAATACKKEGAASQTATVTTAAPPKNDPLLVKVNELEIHQSELDAALASVPENMRAGFVDDAGKRELLEELVKMKVLEAEARRMGLQNDPQNSARISMAVGNILANAAVEKISDTQPVPEPELRALYEKNREALQGVRVSQILLSYAGSEMPSRSGRSQPAQVVFAHAQSLIKRLKAGESFEKMASAESDDQNSASRGGDLGIVARGMLPPALEQKVFALPDGGVSAPLQSRYGFHIFKATGRGLKPFEEVRPVLEREGKREHVQKLVADLRKKATVKFEAAAPKGAAPLPAPTPGPAPAAPPVTGSGPAPAAQ